MDLTEITHDPIDAQHLPIKNLKLVEDKYFTFEVQSNLEVEKKDKRGKEKVNLNKSTFLSFGVLRSFLGSSLVRPWFLAREYQGRYKQKKS